jgi:hypothetical protein
MADFTKARPAVQSPVINGGDPSPSTVVRRAVGRDNPALGQRSAARISDRVALLRGGDDPARRARGDRLCRLSSAAFWLVLSGFVLGIDIP